MKVIKRRNRNAISRHIHAKHDKEKIAGWSSDLTRILQVFNVRSFISVWLLLTRRSQTELAVNTHVIVTELEQNVTSTHIMVTEIHHSMAQVQHGNGSKNLSVSGGRTLTVTGCPLTAVQAQTRLAI